MPPVMGGAIAHLNANRDDEAFVDGMLARRRSARDFRGGPPVRRVRYARECARMRVEFKRSASERATNEGDAA